MYAVVVVMLLFAINGACSLRLRDFNVPAVVMRGDPVRLNCSYDLELDTLYSIKWHKNNIEFYRYLPEDNPPAQKYELPGIYLDLSRSKEGNIYMSKTDVDSEGTYRCEVSTEALFQTVRGEREMRIYVNPSYPPQIRGTKQQYLGGETVNATCISAPSRPEAMLKWWINEKEAPKEYLSETTVRESPDGLFTSIRLLTFKVTSDHFWNSQMRLICEAIIPQVQTLRSEEILISEKSILRTIYGLYDSQKGGPTITGGKNKYTVGDVVDLNCTSGKSQPAAELQWFINGREAKSHYVIRQQPIHHVDGYLSTVLGLRFEVKHRHFQNGEMRLRCTATLSEVMRMISDPQVAIISQQQMSDLHVDFNSGIMTSGCQRKCRLQTIICLVLLYIFTKRTVL